MTTPFYDPRKSYEENFNEGPFGAFQDDQIYQSPGPKENFLGFEVNEAFGIPAGPLLNSKFVIAAFKKGFDLPTFKTVRTVAHKSHPWPNVLPVDVEGDLTLEKASHGLTTKGNYTDPIAITNSFGVPSPPPDVWQPDMKKAVEGAGDGQVMIASYQGTARGDGHISNFIQDHVTGAQLVMETGAKIIEINLSCPNEGSSTLLCHDTPTVVKIADRVKETIGNTPLLLKMAYFPDDEPLRDFLTQLAPIVDGFCMINTIASTIHTPEGTQALPGEKRLRSGVCGKPIMWAGLDMIQRSAKIRAEIPHDFALIGTGGLTTPEDYQTYRQAGADAAMSATAAMWNPYLAQEIKAAKL